MLKPLRKLRSAWRLPRREKAWFLLLYPLSGAARAALLSIPFRLVARFLGRHHGNFMLSPLVAEGQLRLARRIGEFCEFVSRFTPWESKCLVQAIMVKALLNHYGIPCAIHLGVTKPGGFGPSAEHAKEMKAHAWVVVGACAVAGRDGHRAFTVVSTFVSPSLLDPCADGGPSTVKAKGTRSLATAARS